MKRQIEQPLHHISIQDIPELSPVDGLIKYSDDELVIVDDLREIPLLNSKIAFNVVAVCVSGRLQVEVSGKTTEIEAGQIFICHSHATLSNFMISPDFECKMMCISDRLLRTILASQMQIWTKMLYKQTCCILKADIEHFSIYGELRYRWLHEESPFKREILFSLLRAVLLEICEDMLIIEQTEQPEHKPLHGSSRMENIFQHFMENIARRRIKKLPVSTYAEELYITPKYFSTVCHTVSGKAPSEWISEYVLQDVIYYLRNTNLTASQISNELGFSNPSFFGKYVREHLGVSPNKYRKKM